MIFKVPPNPDHSVILWFYKYSEIASTLTVHWNRAHQGHHMEGLESSMLSFILEQTMRMTHEKPLALCLLHFLTELLSVVSHFLWVLQSLFRLGLSSCVFHALPRNPEVFCVSGSSGTLWKSAFVFSSQRIANTPGWSIKENVHLLSTPSNKVSKSEKHIHLLSQSIDP